jgi:hypothetical protein
MLVAFLKPAAGKFTSYFSTQMPAINRIKVRIENVEPFQY